MKKLYTLLFILPSFFAHSQIAGTWVMAPKAGSLKVGPGQGLGDWWSNDQASVTGRACFFDDEFQFDSNGTFSNVMGTDTWVEEWQGATADGCDVPVSPHDGSNAATWAYNSGDSTLTVTGVGAHIGIPKAINGAELSDSTVAVPNSITYKITLFNGDNSMYADIDIRNTPNDPGWWRFELARKGTVDTTGNVGISSVIENNFNVYPNPANNNVTINYKVTNVNNAKISVLDITGKVISTLNVNNNNSIVLNTENYHSGLYFINLIDNEKVITKKLYINH